MEPGDWELPWGEWYLNRENSHDVKVEELDVYLKNEWALSGEKHKYAGYYFILNTDFSQYRVMAHYNPLKCKK